MSEEPNHTARILQDRADRANVPSVEAMRAAYANAGASAAGLTRRSERAVPPIHDGKPGFWWATKSEPRRDEQ